MPYGLQVNNSAGDTIYDSTTSTWLQVDQFIVEANTTFRKIYDFYDGFKVIVQTQMVNAPAESQESYAPIVKVSLSLRYQKSSQTQVYIYPDPGKTSEKIIATVLAQG